MYVSNGDEYDESPAALMPLLVMLPADATYTGAAAAPRQATRSHTLAELGSSAVVSITK